MTHQISDIRFPREYRASLGWKVSLFIAGSVCICLGGWLGWFVLHESSSGLIGSLLFGSLAVAFALLGIVGPISAIKSKVTLFADRIEIAGLTSQKMLLLSQIRGWRIMPTTPSTLVLQPREEHLRPIKTGLLFPVDNEFSDWLDKLPSLDAEETSASLDDIEKNSDFGNTPLERSETLRRAQGQSKGLTLFGILALLWGFFYPHPYALAVASLSMLPWIGVAMVVRSNGILRIDQRRNDAHPTVAYAVIFPPLVLLLRAVLDFNVIWSIRLALVSFAIGTALTAAELVADSATRKMKGTSVVLFLISLVYGYGVTVEANALLDHSPGTIYATAVQDKYVDNGKHISYNLKLAPWGPKTGQTELEVGKRTYTAIQPGDVVSIELQPGALGVNWYYLTSWHRTDYPRQPATATSPAP
jgi:hypothetical protein